jgi:hypothetical protein
VTVLEDIVAGVREDLAARESVLPFDELKIRAAAPPRATWPTSPTPPRWRRTTKTAARA